MRNPSIIVPRRATLGLLALTTAIPLGLIGMNTDVALSNLASCRTRLIGAKLFGRLHRLCLLFHILPNAYERLFFQVLLPFSPISGVVP